MILKVRHEILLILISAKENTISECLHLIFLLMFEIEAVPFILLIQSNSKTKIHCHMVVFLLIVHE